MAGVPGEKENGKGRSRAETRGDRRETFSPTGSSPERKCRGVTNEKVASSRARLRYGHKAPGNGRPQTRRGRIVIETGRKQVACRSSRAVKAAPGGQGFACASGLC